MMRYKIYKLHFSTGLHVGNGMLTDAEPVFHADTLFSALCLNALQIPEGIETLYEKCQNKQIRFSDGLPFIGKTLYIPKPFLTFDTDGDEGSSVKKKAFKKLKYIPADKISTYIKGKLDAEKEAELLKTLGVCEMRTNVKIEAGEDAKPYHVGVYHFQEGNGLYVCGAFRTAEDEKYFCDLLKAAGISGIGGRRSSGLGKFTVEEGECAPDFQKRLEGEDYADYISLSVSLPQKEELELACDGSHYMLLKRSGFVYSSSYAQHFQKKRTIYSFAPGSCIKNRYEGGIYDVSAGGGHPVYRYELPLFLGVNE